MEAAEEWGRPSGTVASSLSGGQPDQLTQAGAVRYAAEEVIGCCTLSVVDERQFFTEKPEQRPATFQCPRCRRTNEYGVRWLRRTKKAQPPAGADARARAMFDKVKDHLVRVDDDVTCKTCGKRFEIPSHRGLVFLEELEGLPKDDYDE
jgi:transcription elongation factor Elf1